MYGAWAVLRQSSKVDFSAITFMHIKLITGVLLVQLLHIFVSRYFRHYRSQRNRSYFLVALDDGFGIRKEFSLMILVFDVKSAIQKTFNI